jgi:hypothetical protein
MYSPTYVKASKSVEFSHIDITAFYVKIRGAVQWGTCMLPVTHTRNRLRHVIMLQSVVEQKCVTNAKHDVSD